MTTPFLMSAFVLLSWDKLSYVMGNHATVGRGDANDVFIVLYSS
jgi:hypothetical protein